MIIRSINRGGSAVKVDSDTNIICPLFPLPPSTYHDFLFPARKLSKTSVCKIRCLSSLLQSDPTPLSHMIGRPEEFLKNKIHSKHLKKTLMTLAPSQNNPLAEFAIEIPHPIYLAKRILERLHATLLTRFEKMPRFDLHAAFFLS